MSRRPPLFAAGLLVLAAASGACSSPDHVVYAQRVTLVSGEPLRDTWCFGTDAYGRGLQDGEVRNFGAQIEFGVAAPGELSVIGSGGERGTIVNLGAQSDDAFAALSSGSPELAGFPAFNRGAHESTAVHTGDLCVVRIEKLATAIGPHAEDSTAWIKLQVLGVEPSGQMTFRWALL